MARKARRKRPLSSTVQVRPLEKLGLGKRLIRFARTAFFPLVEKLPKKDGEKAEVKEDKHDPLASTDFGARKFEEEEEHEKKKRGRLEALQELVRRALDL